MLLFVKDRSEIHIENVTCSARGGGKHEVETFEVFWVLSDPEDRSLWSIKTLFSREIFELQNGLFTLPGCCVLL